MSQAAPLGKGQSVGFLISFIVLLRTEKPYLAIVPSAVHHVRARVLELKQEISNYTYAGKNTRLVIYMAYCYIKRLTAVSQE